MAYLTPMGTQGFPRQMFVNLVQPFGQLYSLHIYQYNKTRHLYMYILCIAGQTAGPIGMIFLRTLMGYRLKKFEIIFQNFFFKIFCYFVFHGKTPFTYSIYMSKKPYYIIKNQNTCMVYMRTKYMGIKCRLYYRLCPTRYYYNSGIIRVKSFNI